MPLTPAENLVFADLQWIKFSSGCRKVFTSGVKQARIISLRAAKRCFSAWF